MTLNMNNGRARYFQIKDLNTRANLCKNIFNQEPSKNDNGAVVMRKTIVQRKRKQQLHQFKKRRTKCNRIIPGLCPYVLVFV